MKRSGCKKIDFVIPWVDGNDPAWQQEKAKYSGKPAPTQDARDIRFRDWGLLRYWFRGIEKNAPWVNRIYFITCGHFPSWLNTEHPKLKCVKHSDYMPSDYLPTFSSHPIELNMHRIKGLSEHFVYFNDDFYLLNPTVPEDFFVDGLPCDCLIESAITPRIGEFSSILCKNVGVINDHFPKKEIYKQVGKVAKLSYGKLLIRTMTMLPYHHIMGFYNPHICQSFRKSTFEEVWEAEFSTIDWTCKNRFRDLNDVSQYLMRYWALCKGEFYPSAPIGKYMNLSEDISKICHAIVTPASDLKVLTLNDAADVVDLEHRMKMVQKAFSKRFPEKSSFELFDLV